MRSPSYTSSPGTIIVDLVGSWGRWQFQFFLLFLLFSVLVVWHSLQYTFLAPNIDFWCVDDTFGNDSLNVCPGNCTKWSYNVGADNGNSTFYRSTILSEWDLICDRAWMAKLSHTIYTAGSFLAGLISAHASDRFGRRPIILIGWTLGVLASLSAALSSSYLHFLISRFVIGFGMTTVMAASSVLILEIVGPKYRELVGIAVDLGWPVGYCLLPGIVWYLRDFRHLLYVCTAVQLSFLLLYKCLPESPRWLLARGRYKEAAVVLKNAVKLNGTNLEITVDEVIANMENHNLINSKQDKAGKEYSLLDLFTNWKMVHLTITVFFLWFANSFVYYGLSLNTNALAGDPFLNFFLLGVIEFPSYLVSMYLVKVLGAKRTFIVASFGAGLSCWASVSIVYSHSLGIVSTMIGKFCISISYAIVYIYTTQVFPTVVRTIALGSSSMISRFGFLLAPYLSDLSEKTSFTFSMAIVGIIAIAAGLAILPLADSTGSDMPDKPEDLEHGTDQNTKQMPELELENLARKTIK